MSHSQPSALRRVWSFFFQSPLDWLILAVPVAFVIHYVPALHNETLLFGISAVGIIPLAGWMGRSTEAIAERVGAGVGGLLNATFGNAAELIIALMALSKGLSGVVKASLTGSIIGNLLLVMGASSLAGGLRFSKQTFNQTGARISATSMSLASIALIMPTVFHHAAHFKSSALTAGASQKLSLAIAIVLFATYFVSLPFYLITHKGLFAGSVVAEECEPEERKHSIWPSIALLAFATLLVAFLSEFLVGAISAAQQSLGLTETFVGVVILAIIGNAAEHSTAVWAALKNNMELSIGVSIGSSMQVALFVTPVLVFASYAFGQPMDLEFTMAEIVAIVLAVWIAGQITGDGESNWLEGVQLLSVYLILAILFYFLPETAVH